VQPGTGGEDLHLFRGNRGRRKREEGLVGAKSIEREKEDGGSSTTAYLGPDPLKKEPSHGPQKLGTLSWGQDRLLSIIGRKSLIPRGGGVVQKNNEESCTGEAGKPGKAPYGRRKKIGNGGGGQEAGAGRLGSKTNKTKKKRRRKREQEGRRCADLRLKKAAT